MMSVTPSPTEQVYLLMLPLKKVFVLLLTILSLSLGVRAVHAQEQSDSDPAKIKEMRERLDPQNVNKTPEQITLEKLTSLLAPVGVSVNKSILEGGGVIQSHHDMQVKWEAYENAPEAVQPDDQSFPADKKLTVVGKRKREGKVPQPNGVSVNDMLLLVAAVNEKAELVWWTQIDDTRVLFAESWDDKGKMSGQRLHASRPILFLKFPDDPRIREIRLYQFKPPDLQLELINAINVREVPSEGGANQ
jgi:hypothetical protein